MRRIFTFSFITIALSLVSFNSFGQCGGVQYNFNDGTTQGFTGSGATFTNSGNPTFTLLYSNVSNGTLTLTTPTLKLLNSSVTTIDFGYIYGHGSQANITLATVAVKYVNTLGNVVTGSPQSFTNAATVCTSITKPSDMITTGANANSYQLIFTFTVTGNGGGAANITLDDYRTSSTAANIILPVKFQSLEATSSNNAVTVKWMVGTEEHLNGYEVEKGTDGRTFSKLAFVSANNQSSYSFVDSKSAGTVYYRIRSVDLDGRYAFSTIALVKAGKSLIVLNAYPSPFVNSFNLDHGTATTGSLITISAEDGRIIKTIIPTTGAQRTPVDLSAAKAGMYLVRFKNTNGEVETLKILKQQ